MHKKTHCATSYLITLKNIFKTSKTSQVISNGTPELEGEEFVGLCASRCTAVAQLHYWGILGDALSLFAFYGVLWAWLIVAQLAMSEWYTFIGIQHSHTRTTLHQINFCKSGQNFQLDLIHKTHIKAQ